MNLAPVEPSSRAKVVRHCALHTIVSAVPSFVLAVIFGWNELAQIIGLLTGIAVFLFLAILVHLTRPLLLMMNAPFSSRALHWAKRIRIIHALLVLPCLLVQNVSWIAIPDMWAGVFANFATEALGFGSVLGPNSISEISVVDKFMQAFLATFIEGWILAGGVAVLCFAIWCLLRLISLWRRREVKNLTL